MKITITVETGNAEMKSGSDVCNAIMQKFAKISGAVDSGKVDGGKIMDVNGNSVGAWEVEND